MFQSGLSIIDKLVAKHGLALQGNNAFRAVTAVNSDSAEDSSLRLPYCIYTRVKALDACDDALLVRLFLPTKQARLAAFLIVNGSIVEQVYYQRDRKYVSACKKIQQAYDDMLVTPTLFAA